MISNSHTTPVSKYTTDTTWNVPRLPLPISPCGYPIEVIREYEGGALVRERFIYKRNGSITKRGGAVEYDEIPY